ncbi:hypothetical protein AB6F25_22725 [Vibrio splendidus]
MAIKNWTVTVESARSVLAREIYLTDINHKNHTNTEQIINIIGSPQTTLNIEYQCEKRRLAQAVKRKGGRPPTAGMEYVFCLPKGIRPAPEQWRSMIKHVITSLSRSMGISPKHFNGIVRAVLHQQDSSPEGKGAGDHIHLILGKHSNEGLFLTALQKRAAIRVAKLSFNHAVWTELGISHNDYVATKTYAGTAKKKAPQWKVMAARQKEEQEQLALSIERNLTKTLNQCEKWLLAFEQGNKRQMSRQYNRISKSLEQLTDKEIKNDKLVRLIDLITTTIDNKSKRPTLSKLMKTV